MKIIKHSSQTFPTVATGSIVGMDVNGTLEITNCFPFPTIDIPAEAATSSHAADNYAQMAAAAPRAKANQTYQADMTKMLREVNVDSQNVGWYTSTNMGNFINANTIENQYFYQKEMTERTVALVHDVSRSAQGALSLRAFRLTTAFMTAYKEGKFTVDA
jgi:translation initiation factor 3 subunit H